MRILKLMVFTLLPAILILADDANDGRSSFSRGLASQGAHMTTFPEAAPPRITRARYPEDNPQICLAFLSCCGRTDLLNHTIHAAIHHMEHDEPKLRYEIAWVDNGSGDELTRPIEASYQIEHALPLPQNAGLAYGMNLLIFNLCQAPYILLLEEDWLYLDEIVASPTPQRNRAIATAISLLEQRSLSSFDGRKVMGVFLRPESYGSFLKHPYAHEWATTTVNISDLVGPSDKDEQFCNSSSEPNCENMDGWETPVDYQIYCADNTFVSSNSVWGSYTNGAGLYSRQTLAEIGRMYGEPGDAFHDRYVEANYAYRASLHYCHAALQLGSCRDIGNPECTAAFHHIGHGRGTRPRTTEGSKCVSQGWAFYGTPAWDKFLQLNGGPICSDKELQELRDIKAKEADSADYRKEVQEDNKKAFQMEQSKREKLRVLAQSLRTFDKEDLRQQIDWLKDKSDEEIIATVNNMEAWANSAHPLKGFWDMHGRPLV